MNKGKKGRQKRYNLINVILNLNLILFNIYEKSYLEYILHL